MGGIIMIKDLTISYVCSGIETTLTIKDDHYNYDNMPYNIAGMNELADNFKL